MDIVRVTALITTGLNSLILINMLPISPPGNACTFSVKNNHQYSNDTLRSNTFMLNKNNKRRNVENLCGLLKQLAKYLITFVLLNHFTKQNNPHCNCHIWFSSNKDIYQLFVSCLFPSFSRFQK